MARSLARIIRGVGLILRGGREIEQSDRQTPFVQSIDQDRQVERIGAECCIFGRPGLAGLAVGGRSGAGITPRYHDDIGFEIDTELQSPRMNDGTVGGNEFDAGTSLGGRHDDEAEHRAQNERSRYAVIDLHFHSILLVPPTSTNAPKNGRRGFSISVGNRSGCEFIAPEA